VTDVTWRYTTIRALPNNLIVVPNAKLASAIVTNYNLPETDMAVLVDVGVSYDSDLERVERVTSEVARETMRDVPGGMPGFEPFIRYHTFSDFSINFTAIRFVRDAGISARGSSRGAGNLGLPKGEKFSNMKA
jgi:small-conductance mechanosensitive channel